MDIQLEEVSTWMKSFFEQGGTTKMLEWSAQDPHYMRKIVGIFSDDQLLAAVNSGVRQKGEAYEFIDVGIPLPTLLHFPPIERAFTIADKWFLLEEWSGENAPLCVKRRISFGMEHENAVAPSVREALTMLLVNALADEKVSLPTCYIETRNIVVDPIGGRKVPALVMVEENRIHVGAWLVGKEPTVVKAFLC